MSNEPILENLERLKKSGRPFRIRIPVIPGVNDSDENFEQTALRLLDAENLEQVELLPYHVTAGAKYEMVGLSYQPEFDTAAAPNLNTELFRRFGAEVYPSVGQRHICTEDRSAGIIKNCAEAFLLRSFCV